LPLGDCDDLGDCDIIFLLGGVYVKSEEHLCGMLFDPYGFGYD